MRLPSCLRSLAVFGLLLPGLPSAHGQQVIPLWPAGAPGLKHERPEQSDDKRETGRQDRWISYVSEPTLTIYSAPADRANGTAVLVIPGGGFRYVCIDKEGIEPAQWLNSLGITAAVLKYRTLDPEKERSAKTIEPLFAETERALRVLRQHAADLKIDPKRIGTLGFSAGAIMSLRLVADADEGNPQAADPAENMPNFVIFVYGAPPPGKPARYSKSAPPFFIVHAADDPKAPAAGAIKVFDYLRDAGVSAELHIYRRGDHGFGQLPKAGTVREWPAHCAAWLRDIEMIPAAQP